MYDNAFGCKSPLSVAPLRPARRAFFVFSIFVSLRCQKAIYSSFWHFSALIYGKSVFAFYSRAHTSSSAHLLPLRLAVGFAYAPSAPSHAPRSTTFVTSGGALVATLRLVRRTACPARFQIFLVRIRSAPA